MNRTIQISALVLACAATAGCSRLPMPEVRGVATNAETGTETAALDRARALFARGEHALAAEQFRKVIREQPDSAAGYNGLAASYDMIGRFDLASRYYEMALARAPEDGRIYRNMARSLQMQGREGEALAVLAELEAISSRTATAATLPSAPESALAGAPAAGVEPIAELAAAAVQPLSPASVAAPPQPVAVQNATAAKPVVRGTSVDIALAAPEGPVEKPLAVQAIPHAAYVAAPRPVVRGPSVQVALAPSSAARPSALAAVRIMNAAGRKGIAGRMQAYLARSGTRAQIGDADRRLPQSWIIYPKAARAEAAALRRKLPFAVRVATDERARRVVLLLGQDAAAHETRRRRAERA